MLPILQAAHAWQQGMIHIVSDKMSFYFVLPTTPYVGKMKLRLLLLLFNFPAPHRKRNPSFRSRESHRGEPLFIVEPRKDSKERCTRPEESTERTSRAHGGPESDWPVLVAV